MRMAVRLARRGAGFASPNPTVGCVVVQGEQVVGRGWHDYGKFDHAEVVAIREAGAHARGAEAYVTLEPCSHYGRTPPCAELLASSGIGRVVVGMIDPNPLVSGRGIEYLGAHGIETEVGVLAAEVAELLEPFACRVSAGRPLVVGKAGMSLDGRIAAPGGTERRLTSRESDGFTQELRLRADAILVGIGTVLKDDPLLTYRGRAGRRRPLVRVILDSQLRTPPRARLFDDAAGGPVLIFCSADCDSARRRTLEQRGAEVIAGAGAPGRPGLDLVLRELMRRDVNAVLVEGGSETHWAFLHAGLFDKFYFIVAPLVLGGTASVPVVGGEGYPTISDAERFRIRRSFTSGPDLVIEAFPAGSRSILSPWRG
jgi:diaminohydroxyphosphoribosylaminopyrimidine deaminase / 5-amino-6-(5-phosphoribosylamino)uracil reductase